MSEKALREKLAERVKEWRELDRKVRSPHWSQRRIRADQISALLAEPCDCDDPYCAQHGEPAKPDPLPLGHTFVAITLDPCTWEGEPGSKPDECAALIESNFTTSHLRCGQPRSAHLPQPNPGQTHYVGDGCQGGHAEECTEWKPCRRKHENDHPGIFCEVLCDDCGRPKEGELYT